MAKNYKQFEVDNSHFPLQFIACIAVIASSKKLNRTVVKSHNEYVPEEPGVFSRSHFIKLFSLYRTCA